MFLLKLTSFLHSKKSPYFFIKFFLLIVVINFLSFSIEKTQEVSFRKTNASCQALLDQDDTPQKIIRFCHRILPEKCFYQKNQETQKNESSHFFSEKSELFFNSVNVCDRFFLFDASYKFRLLTILSAQSHPPTCLVA